MSPSVPKILFFSAFVAVFALLFPTHTQAQYSIQVAAFSSPVASNHFSQRGLDGVASDRKNNFVVYYYGSYTNESEASGDLALVQEKGFPYARVVSPEERNPNCPEVCDPADRQMAPPIPQPMSVPQPVYTPPVEKITIRIENLFFDFDSAVLRAKSIEDLNDLYNLMSANSSYVVEVHGHTDSKGSHAYNVNLANRRKQVVIDYLIGQGLTGSRIMGFSYGEEQPIAKNDLSGSDAPDGRQLNRRVELKVKDNGQELLDVVESIYVPEHLRLY